MTYFIDIFGFVLILNALIFMFFKLKIFDHNLKDANAQREMLNSSLHRLNEHIEGITESILVLSNEIELLDLKSGRDVEYRIDNTLSKILTFMPFTDLRLYLVYVRDVMMTEFKRLIGFKTENISLEILKFTWENIRLQMSNYADSLSAEMKAYNHHVLKNRELDMHNFILEAQTILSTANGSTFRKFTNASILYMENMLKFTVEDFKKWSNQQYNDFKNVSRLDDKNSFLELIKSNKIELCLYKIGENIKNYSTEVESLYISMMFKYNSTKQDALKNLITEEFYNTTMQTIADNLIYFINKHL